MKEFAMQSYGEAKERVVRDMKLLLADTEELLKALAADSKEKVAALRPRVEAAISQARTQLGEMERAAEERARPVGGFCGCCGAPREMERAVEERARQAARETDAYVHQNPWKTAGMAAGLGAALGAITGILLARR
jgi:ElaB/YqjD/DUF883 family membrane-anchored ribosome-binding protein